MDLVGLKQLCYGELRDAKQSLARGIALARSVEHRSALGRALTWRAATALLAKANYAAADDMLVEAVQLHADLRDGFHLLHPLFLSGDWFEAIRGGYQSRWQC